MDANSREQRLDELKQERNDHESRIVEVNHEIAKLQEEPKKKALSEIKAYTLQAQNALKKAEELADEHGLNFDFGAGGRSMTYSKGGWSSSSDYC